MVWVRKHIDICWIAHRPQVAHIPLEVLRNVFVETQVVHAIHVVNNAIWGAAPMTDDAREAFPQQVQRAWEVRRIGEDEPFALVLRFGSAPKNWWGKGKLISHFSTDTLESAWRSVVMTEIGVYNSPGRYEENGFGTVGDILLGIDPRRDREWEPAPPAEDVAAMEGLIP